MGNNISIDTKQGVITIHGETINTKTTWEDIMLSIPEDKIGIRSSGWCWGRAIFLEPVDLYGIKLWAEIFYQNSRLELRLTPVKNKEDALLFNEYANVLRRENESREEWNARVAKWEKDLFECKKKLFGACVYLMGKLDVIRNYDVGGGFLCPTESGMSIAVIDGTSPDSSNMVTGALRIHFPYPY